MSGCLFIELFGGILTIVAMIHFAQLIAEQAQHLSNIAPKKSNMCVIAMWCLFVEYDNNCFM